MESFKHVRFSFTEYRLLCGEFEKDVITINDVCCLAYLCNIFCCTACLINCILSLAMLADSLIVERPII